MENYQIKLWELWIYIKAYGSKINGFLNQGGDIRYQGGNIWEHHKNPDFCLIFEEIFGPKKGGSPYEKQFSKLFQFPPAYFTSRPLKSHIDKLTENDYRSD